MTITKAPRELLPNAGIILTPRGGSRYSLRRADGANLVPPCVRWVQGQHVGDLLALQSSPEGVVLPVEAVGYYGAEGNAERMGVLDEFQRDLRLLRNSGSFLPRANQGAGV